MSVHSNVEPCIDKALLGMPDLCRAYTRYVGFRIRGYAVDYTPVVTGKLRASWRLGPVRISFGSYSIKILNTDDKARYVEFNTRPHIIRPKTPGGVLSWVGRFGRVFAREVHHPGTTGQHMLARALARMDAELRETGESHLRKWAIESGLA